MGKVLFVKTYQKLTKCEQDMEMLLHTLVASDLWCSMSRKGIQTQGIILRLDQHCSAIPFSQFTSEITQSFEDFRF